MAADLTVFRVLATDTLHGGRGLIAGTLPDGIVTVGSVPTGGCEIEVRERLSRHLVATRRSLPDGSYEFRGLNPAERFDVIARDWSGTYEDVIVGGVTPIPY
jgi:hypothetical protein